MDNETAKNLKEQDTSVWSLELVIRYGSGEEQIDNTLFRAKSESHFIEQIAAYIYSITRKNVPPLLILAYARNSSGTLLGKMHIH